MIFSVIVFVDNQFVGTIDGGVTKWWDSALFVHTEHDADGVEKFGMRRIEIDLTNIVPLIWPVNRIVVLGIELLIILKKSD